MEAVIRGEEKGPERKKAIIESLKAILEGLDDVIPLELPVDIIMNIADHLIEILFSILKRTGNLEPDTEIEYTSLVNHGDARKPV